MEYLPFIFYCSYTILLCRQTYKLEYKNKRYYYYYSCVSQTTAYSYLNHKKYLIQTIYHILYLYSNYFLCILRQVLLKLK